jgi:hypothetical protein
MRLAGEAYPVDSFNPTRVGDIDLPRASDQVKPTLPPLAQDGIDDKAWDDTAGTLTSKAAFFIISG